MGVSDSVKTPCVPCGGFYVLYDEAAEVAAEEKSKEEEAQMYVYVWLVTLLIHAIAISMYS